MRKNILQKSIDECVRHYVKGIKLNKDPVKPWTVAEFMEEAFFEGLKAGYALGSRGEK